ncbi:MAG: site-specific integrase, partial [Clostridiales bacterium]|nr:site-specific integrase [Clostridiales bacterium]
TWLKEYQSKKKYNTYREYESIYRLYIKDSSLSKVKISDLKPMHLNKYYNDLLTHGIKDSKIVTINARIKTCLNEAERQDLILKNYAKNITLPVKKEINTKQFKALTREDQDKLIKYLDTKDDPRALAIQFDLGTGLRIGELLGLKWEDIDVIENRVNVIHNLQYEKDENGRIIHVLQTTKNENSIRSVPIPEELVKKLKIHKIKQYEIKLKLGEKYNDEGFVFVNNLGNLYHRTSFRDYLNKALKDLNINHIKVHGLRHSYATRLFEANVPPKTIQILLGHADITTTLNIYTHVDEKQKELAVEKLNNLFM